jgi:hypothetical protein
MVEVGYREIHSGSVRGAPPGCSGNRRAVAHTSVYRDHNRDIPEVWIEYDWELARAVWCARYAAARTIMGAVAAADPLGASGDLNE